MSPEYLSPGVYVEEVDRGTKPIEGAGTAMAAFVGFAEKGPVNQPTFIPNWMEFVNNFGGFVNGVYLAPAVYGYFQNGGGRCYVTRLPGGGEEEAAEPNQVSVVEYFDLSQVVHYLISYCGKPCQPSTWDIVV